MNDDLIKNKPLPYKSHLIDVAGYCMHYLDEGSGPIVVLLHGNPTWCYYYRNLLATLKDKFRVIVPDYIGCGLSEQPTGKHFRAIDRVEHLEELLRKLEANKYSLVMHDWGGSIGTALATRNIQAIEKLVYLNTTITETESLPRIIRVAAKPFFGKFLTKYSKRFLKLATDFGVYKKLLKEVRQAYFYPYQTSDRRDSIWDFVADIPFDSSHPTYSLMLELGSNLPKLAHIPVQIVWGLKDPCFHREMLSKVAQHFPQARVLEIPHASHLVLEDATDLAGNTIREFLLTEQSSLAEEAAQLAKARAREPERGENALYAEFVRQVRIQPRSDAVIAPSIFGETVRYAHMNFQALYQLIMKYQRGLYELGLRSGDKVVMLVAPGIEFLALSYAVMGRGAIPVFIDPGMGKENLCACIAEISPQVFIASPKAHLLRVLNKKLFTGLKFHIMASEWVFVGGPNLSFLKKFSSRELPGASSPGIAMIAFTSGATGKPKGVIFTDTMVSQQVKIFKETFGIEAGKKDLPLLPIFSLYNLANGVCSVIAPLDPSKPLDFAPERVLRIINDLGIDYSFGSPTLWNKIAEYCIRTRQNLNTLKKILVAGAPVPIETLTKIRSVMNEGEVYTPYGSTEALPVTGVSSAEIVDREMLSALSGEVGTLVGKPVDGVKIKIIREVAGPIPTIKEVEELVPYSIGEIIVKGKNVSPQYWDLPDATLQSKIKDDESFWHRMGDVGYFDDSGNLYFCGRKAHVVRCQGRTYYSIPVEKIFNTHKKVRRSALVSLYGGQEVGIVIEPQPEFWPESPESKRLFLSEIKQLAISSKLTNDIKNIYFHRSFPVDARHNAKIFRDKLGLWASEERNTLDNAA